MLIGGAALVANALLWYFGLHGANPPFPVLGWTWVLALVLPAVAAWRSTKWWLVLSLSPIVLVICVVQGLHPC
jgi:hypothetical protein